MDNSLLASLQQLELLAFFSGYPLIYSLVRVAAGNRSRVAAGNRSRVAADNRPGEGSFRGRLTLQLPSAYALLGTLYLGFRLKNLYPDYSFGHISWVIRQNYLQVWGILAILFWLPALRQRPALSLFHSLLFFFFLVYDLVRQYFNAAAPIDIVRNDMTVYTVSLVINLGVYALVTLFSVVRARYINNEHS
jgi:hypothetical protein